METRIKGRAYILGDNIDTDQIIPAEHLVYSLDDPEESKKYGHFALCGLPANHSPFVEESEDISNYQIIIAGNNFGCGSSREHAPFALWKAGVKAVIALSYARIFYRNSVDGGFLVPLETPQLLNNSIKTGDEVEINLDNYTLTRVESGEVFQLKELGDVLPIISAGGLFEYARKSQMI